MGRGGGGAGQVRGGGAGPGRGGAGWDGQGTAAPAVVGVGGLLRRRPRVGGSGSAEAQSPATPIMIVSPDSVKFSLISESGGDSDKVLKN